jgi:hypothetical protein
METTPQPARPAWEHRLQAILALLGGEPVPDVTARSGMGRSILLSGCEFCKCSQPLVGYEVI